MSRSPILSLVVVLPPLLGCGAARSYNYPDPTGPRYGGSWVLAPGPALQATFRVVTFNVKFARHIDEAAETLMKDKDLKDADIVHLQEMDLTGTERIACALGRHFVYYPAALHPGTGSPLRPFGVAILSRWPIVADVKLPLPPLSHSDKAQKTSAAAIVDVDGRWIRSVNMHLQTGLPPDAMRQQLGAAFELLEQSLPAPPGVPTVVTGDFNSYKQTQLKAIAEEMNVRQLLPVFDHTLHTFTVAGIPMPIQLDHIFVSRILMNVELTQGVRGMKGGSSDHYPLRADLPLPAPGEQRPANIPRDQPLLCPMPSRQRPTR